MRNNLLNTIKDFFLLILNYIFLFWAFFPILCLSDDANCPNIAIKDFKRENVKKSFENIRISIVCLYWGEYAIHFLSWNNKNFDLIKIISLSKHPTFDLDELDYTKYFQELMSKRCDEKAIRVERDALMRYIENHNRRISKSDAKLNIITVIFLAFIPFLGFDKIIELVKSLLDCFDIWQIPKILLIYYLFNLFLFLLQCIKVRAFNASNFNDLRENNISQDKLVSYVAQIYYDYLSVSKRAQLYVSFTHRIYDYLRVIFVVLIVVFSTIVIGKNTSLTNTSEDEIFSLTILEWNKTYSESSKTFKKVLLNLETKEYEKIFVLYRNEIPMEMKKIFSNYNHQPYSYRKDENLTEK